MLRPTVKHFFVILLAGLAVLLNGCISASYQGEDFPPTATVTVLSGTPELLKDYRIIGHGEASGGFSAVSNRDLQEKLCRLGQAHGAEALVITGTRIVPEGHIADPAEENFIIATDDPDQVQTQLTFNADISSSSAPAATAYKRIMYAVFLRKK